MQIGLSGGQVNAFWRGDDADIDSSPASLRDKGVKNLVIMNEEVQMEPKGVSQYDFRELIRPILFIDIGVRFRYIGSSNQLPK